MKIVEVVLRVPFPDSVTNEEAAEFAADAVSWAGGSRRPPGGHGPNDAGDPLFGVRRVEIVSARRIARRRKPATPLDVEAV